MRPTLRASSARLIVGHVDPDEVTDLLATIESRTSPTIFVLAEPEGLRLAAAVPAGASSADDAEAPLRWGKLVVETVANEVVAHPGTEISDALVNGLQVAHRRLGGE